MTSTQSEESTVGHEAHAGGGRESGRKGVGPGVRPVCWRRAVREVWPSTGWCSEQRLPEHADQSSSELALAGFCVPNFVFLSLKV